tara:strand:+ start:18477 stop:20270 length:1794 start_codon:yes stop_codon:yes gene_type:complete
MCGFIGKISFKQISKNELEIPNKRLTCRGPDSCVSDFYTGEDINYEIFFNRLTILDLSDKANQPMASKDNNSILMFNGEIFNHGELRKDLEKKRIKFFTNNSDTETILNGLNYYGVSFIEKLRGQFAIFYLNKKEKRIVLARDRLGQKPLYYKLDKESIIFSSNLISLLELEGSYSINEEEVVNYLKYGIVSSPNTLFKDFKKLLPSQIIQLNYENNRFHKDENKYWDTSEKVDNKKFDKDEFFSLFSESINLRLNADVPVANFLSGGIDSTSIVKNLYDSDQKINTFSVNVSNKKYDESKWSDLAAEKYETNHVSIELSSEIETADIENALGSLDEPYSDPSVVPSYLLSREISNYFKVAISGDGGDELLGGYKRVVNTINSKSNLSKYSSYLYSLYPSFLGTGNYFLSRDKNKSTAYRSYLEDQKFLDLLEVKNNSIEGKIEIPKNENFYKSLLQAEYKFYLPEMMMYKIDRTSMANSLEIRSPFVDHLLIEYMLSHDTDYYDSRSPKKLLKEYLYGDLGTDFVQRPKQGFVFDIENWIYKNNDMIKENLFNGSVSKMFNIKKLNLLSFNKSRINAHRIWKIFVLENYLSRLRIL